MLIIKNAVLADGVVYFMVVVMFFAQACFAVVYYFLSN